MPVAIPGEATLAVGASARNEARDLTLSVLSLATVGNRLRARVRVVVEHGDHEIDLSSPGASIEIDGVELRLVRGSGNTAVIALAEGNGWVPHGRW